MYVVCDTAMIQTVTSGFIRRPTKFDRRRLNRRTLANLAPLISQNRAREMVAAKRAHGPISKAASASDREQRGGASARLPVLPRQMAGRPFHSFFRFCRLWRDFPQPAAGAAERRREARARQRQRSSLAT